MPDGPMTVHAALARQLRRHGVDRLFGLLGDSNLFLGDAFVRAEGGTFVPATSEANAVLMALGHAAMTGGIGVSTVTQGPAVSNALTALIDGVKAKLPMVLICGDTSKTNPGHPQAIAQQALIAATGAGFEWLKSPQTACQDLATAFRRAALERRPIAFNAATELMWETAGDLAPVHAAPPRPTGISDGPAMDDAIGIIAAARRPLVLAGRGAIDARDTLIQLADRIGAPLATTLKAKALFDGHAYNLGVCGTLSTPQASEVIASADCILSFGAGLGPFTTMRGAFLDGTRLVQIDEDPAAIGHHQAPDTALVGNPAAVAERFLYWLDEADIPSSRASDTLPAGTLSNPEPAPPTPPAAPGAGDTIDLTRAIDALNTALPANRVVATDGGRFMSTAWKRLSVSGPENFVLSVNTGAIGLGMGYAIGAAHARPKQTTLFVTGDGGFMLGGLAEFSSVVRDRLDMVVVVCNDQAYGAEYVQFRDRQMDPAMSLFAWPSFAAMARAMGARAVQVTSETTLNDALVELGNRNAAPILIELMLDPAAVPRLEL